MKELAPYISCVCSPDEFDEAITQGYKEIYIVTSKGVIKHHQLRGTNRFVRLKVDTIPGYVEPQIAEGLNFLPAGKIPYAIYEQVLAFFKRVMEVKTAELEAMIHVLYNEELGYHLGVPPQTISKAAVSYDWSYIPAGTSIIVDIHSHNTMGAFFSGTDDGDDRNNISFSGVFGKLKDEVPMTVWRFNYFAKKYTVKAADLFDIVNVGVSLDPALEAQLDNVKTQVYTTYPTYSGGRSNSGNVVPLSERGKTNSGRTYEHLAPYQFKKANQFPTSSSISNQANVPRNQDTLASDIADAEGFGDAGINSTFFDHIQKGTEDVRPGSVWRGPTTTPATNGQASELIVIRSGNKKTSGATVLEAERQERLADKIMQQAMRAASEPSTFSVEEDSSQGGESHLGKSLENGGMDQMENYYNSLGDGGHALDVSDIVTGNPLYEQIHSVHGADVADAWWGIAQEMAELNGKDDLLEELSLDMFNLMSTEGQATFFKRVYNELPEQEKDKIANSGL